MAISSPVLEYRTSTGVGAALLTRVWLEVECVESLSMTLCPSFLRLLCDLISALAFFGAGAGHNVMLNLT